MGARFTPPQRLLYRFVAYAGEVEGLAEGPEGYQGRGTFVIRLFNPSVNDGETFLSQRSANANGHTGAFTVSSRRVGGTNCPLYDRRGNPS